ncbi:MAG: right-handed parallel beta-helix repeat-containing protein [Candidatus Eisenbacteria bacterium]|nr:right-handed parallel beta-helix repeat-containing protein [Candidatus Eisenbacteria bacterium]
MVYAKSIHLFSVEPGGAQIDLEEGRASFVEFGGRPQDSMVVEGFQIGNGFPQDGAVIAIGSGRFEVTGCKFRDLSGGEAAAIQVNNRAQARVFGCEFIGNVCELGVLRTQSSGSTEIESCVFRRNTGTPVRVDGSGSVTLRNCEITNNFGLLGGPSALLSAGQVRIESSLIARNTASIVIDASGELQLFSTTIADNVDGPSVVSRGSLEVERSVIWGNCDAGDVVALVGSAVFTCSAVDSSRVSGGAQIIFGNGVVYADVEFCQTLGCESSDGLGDYGGVYGYVESTCGERQVGACCLGPDCRQESDRCCVSSGGLFLGENTPCAPDVCDKPIAVRRVSWGSIKRRWCVRGARDECSDHVAFAEC